MSTMTGTVGNIEIGPCQVTFNAVDLGYFKGGVSFEYTPAFYDFEADQSTMLLDKRLQTERLVVTVPLLQTTLDSLISASHSLIPTGSRTADSTKRKIEIGGHQVSSTDAKELIIIPLSDGALTIGSDDNELITVHKAFPVPQLKKSYTLGEARVITVEFHGIADTGKSSGNQLFTLGDTTAS